MSVTSLPKFLNILANSIAIIPDPVIATLRGNRFNELMESESKMRFASKGIPPGRKGVDPVAIKILSAFNVDIVPLPLLPPIPESDVTTREEDVRSPSAKEANP